MNQKRPHAAERWHPPYASEETPTFTSPLEGLSEGLSWLARACLLAVLIAAPWVFGGVRFEQQVWLYAGVLCALAMWIVSLLLLPGELRMGRVVIPTLILPLAGALLLGAVQLIPGLPHKLPRLENYAVDAKPAGDEGDSLGRLAPPLGRALASRSQFSIFPAATRVELTRLTVGIAAFLAGLALFTNANTQRLLLGALTANGVCLTVFGIVQKLSWNGKLFWSVPLTQGGQPFASFVNRNNAAGFLNLCLAAAIGYLVLTVWQEHSSDDAAERPQRRPLVPAYYLAALACVAIMTGVCASVSRGGILSGALAGLAVVLLLSVRRVVRVAAWSAGAGLLLCAGLMTWLGLTNGLMERFDETISSSARWDNWQDAWRAVCDFPILGTGFGTYRYAYQPYQTKPVKLWFYNADNHYVEGLTEGGAIGIALVGLCLLLMIRVVWVLVRRGTRHGSDSLAYVALFAVISQLVHAGLDFGISMPSNLLTFAVLCGLLVGEAARKGVSIRPPLSVSLPVWQPALVVGLISVVLIANGWLGIEEVARAGVCRAARYSVPRLTTTDAMNEAQLERQIQRLTEAVRQRPGDAEAQHILGELWVYRYRLQSYLDWKQRSEEAPEAVRIANWTATGLPVLHRYANDAFRDAQFQTIQELRTQSLILENLGHARSHLLAAQAGCPLITHTDLHLAALAFLGEDNPSGIYFVRRTAALAPVDEDQLFAAGLLADQASRGDLSELYWRRSLANGNRHQSEIYDYLLHNLPLSDIVDRILPRTPGAILDLARTKFSEETHTVERDLLIARAQSLLESEPQRFSEAERLFWSGVSARLSGQNDSAVALLTQAVDLNPNMAEWRLELAQCYRAAGRFDDALDQVEIGQSIAIDPAPFKALRAELVHEKYARPTPRSASKDGKTDRPDRVQSEDTPIRSNSPEPQP
ncbi:MAG: O-antigen ligase family protein [Planctomycetia bacterium]|nr:O-antigen ligase family protein [Planctomycetia bacterium]